MKNRIVIIDGNSLINRAYYAMQRPMITKDGIYTQGVYGFINMLTRIIDDYSPDYITVTFDRKSPTFRHIEYDDYKAGRKKMPPELAMQFPILKDVLHAMNIKTMEIDGFEADDIIGTVARVSEEEGLEPLIITGDKDALQLCTDKTKVLITKKGISDFDLYDREKMIERYQLTPQQFIDLKGLMGDQSDNIPGIPGVGEKTGIKLLTQFETMDNLLAHTDEIANAKLRQKVEDNIQMAVMSKRLATINKYVPIEFNLEELKLVEPNLDMLINQYVKLEFNSFLKRLKSNNQDSLKENVPTENQVEKIIINNTEGLSVIESLPEKSKIILKVFSDNNHIEKPVVSGVSMMSEKRYIYVDCQDKSIFEKLIDVFNEKNFEFLGHDLVKDYFSLMSYGLVNLQTDFDTAIAQYIIEPTRSNYEIKTITFENLHYEIKDEKEFWAQNGQINLFDNNSKEYMEYGYTWCQAIRSLKPVLEEKINNENLQNVYYNVELPLIEVLANMECVGTAINEDILTELGESLKKEISSLEETIYNLAGMEFNINSPMQLGEVLFNELKLPAGKKSKRGYSTSADVLEKIRDLHPIVDMVLKYRTISKLNSTYVEGLKPLIGPDGKIRAHFQQTVTATGRISCTEPNLQNIPIRQTVGRQLRKAFVPESNECILVGADYSQIELRVLAHLSSDKSLIEAFNNGEDIHRMTASRVLGVDSDKVTLEDRSRAKAVNFGVIYGMSGFGLSEELKITRKEAENYIKEYFNKHQAVKDYMDQQVESCKDKGYTVTIMGRKRYIHEINSSNYMTRQLGERLAMNSPIQGSAADIIKIAMVKVYKELKERNLESKLILQVHDELIIMTHKHEEEVIKELLVRNMEGAMNLQVKLVSDLNVGNTWYDLK